MLKAGEGSERRKESSSERFLTCWGYIYYLKQNVMKNMYGKCASGEISDGNKKHIIGYWRKDELFSKVTGDLDEFWFAVGRKIELVNNELGYLTEILRQSIEVAAWFIPAT